MSSYAVVIDESALSSLYNWLLSLPDIDEKTPHDVKLSEGSTSHGAGDKETLKDAPLVGRNGTPQ